MGRKSKNRREATTQNVVKTQEQYKAEYNRDLRQLADILHQNFSEYCPNVQPLYKAAESCLESQDSFYQYHIGNLVFNLSENSLRRVLPRGVISASLVLELMIRGLCNIEDAIIDPFNDFTLDITINGIHQEHARSLKSCWHLDRDVPEEDDGKQGFLHPSYHFQYGGRKLREDVFEYGDTFILEMPRLAHPPMDAVLAIDFILVNYYPYKDTEFREEQNYQDLLRNAQKRVWKPYIRALSAWDSETSIPKHVWHPAQIWPQLVING